LSNNCWLEERNALTAVLRAPAFRLSVAYKTALMDTPKVAVPRNTEDAEITNFHDGT